jgi:hypothetical protein
MVKGGILIDTASLKDDRKKNFKFYLDLDLNVGPDN